MEGAGRWKEMLWRQAEEGVIFLFLFFFLVRGVTNSFIFVWSALQPGGVYEQPGTFAHK